MTNKHAILTNHHDILSIKEERSFTNAPENLQPST